MISVRSAVGRLGVYGALFAKTSAMAFAYGTPERRGLHRYASPADRPGPIDLRDSLVFPSGSRRAGSFVISLDRPLNPSRGQPPASVRQSGAG